MSYLQPVDLKQAFETWISDIEESDDEEAEKDAQEVIKDIISLPNFVARIQVTYIVV